MGIHPHPELRRCTCADGDVPLAHDVVDESRHAGGVWCSVDRAVWIAAPW